MLRKIQRSALVPYSAQQMYDLVNDVERYPEFMDGCEEAEILKREPHYMEARLEIKKGALHKSFVTGNRLQPGRRIDMALVEGPFKTLTGAWEFTPLGDDGCKVSLKLAFEFKNRLLGLAANPWFEAITNHLVDALAQRAKQLYGPPSGN